ncbi:MAG: hypothetical protein JW984_16415 [Deltaproteobacteria bacterium]|uniref:Uncharacterized protein n=1 Tax=Candidatus Zymogenus saltonus TaxID=2844893 RepID=A0A9D8KLP5_9DELT|nr:hypothetical protein [Candidatus Zymogenus saltonus]
MPEGMKPDMSYFPYRRKKLYLLMTVPLLLIYILVFIYLWSINFILSLIFLSLYLIMCFFMAYCCVYQDCPYVGGFCPGAAGLMPASILAKLICGNRKIVKSKWMFDINASTAFLAFLGMPFFPLYWLAKLGIVYAIGYFLIHLVYYLVFLLKICEVCAIKHICPGGRFRDKVFKGR